MNFENKTVLITGASGGLGQVLVKNLLDKKANVIISGTNVEKLEKMISSFTLVENQFIDSFACDLSKIEACENLINDVIKKHNAIDVLINMAAVQSFSLLENISVEAIEKEVNINITAPIVLTKSVLRLMKKNNKGTVVNIGSTFGSIAFAHFSVYSATKFGLRGFSEALNRELKDSNVSVVYVAPRGIKTAMNSDAFYQMAKATGMGFDLPEKVAEQIIDAIEKQKNYKFIGFPECIFVRINAIFPKIVTKALAKKNRIAKQFL